MAESERTAQMNHGIKSILRRIEPLVRLSKRLRERRTEFYQFQKRVHPATWANHDLIMEWADNCLVKCAEMEAANNYARSTDPTVTQGYELKKRVEAEYREKHTDWEELRILLYRPEYEQSVGGYSLVGNLAMSLQFMGVRAEAIGRTDNLAVVLESFRPTVLMTSDNERDLGIVDWMAFNEYRKKHHCALGLTASLEEFRQYAACRSSGVGAYARRRLLLPIRSAGISAWERGVQSLLE